MKQDNILFQMLKHLFQSKLLRNKISKNLKHLFRIFIIWNKFLVTEKISTHSGCRNYKLSISNTNFLWLYYGFFKGEYLRYYNNINALRFSFTGSKWLWVQFICSNLYYSRFTNYEKNIVDRWIDNKWVFSKKYVSTFVWFLWRMRCTRSVIIY